MNVDEAIKVAKREALGWFDDMHEAGPILASEVERLRAELDTAKADVEQLRGEYISTQRTLTDTWERAEVLEKELAEAKAASVVPVKWKSSEQFFQSGADRGNQWGIELWFENKEQREQFHKWLKERGERAHNEGLIKRNESCFGTGPR